MNELEQLRNEISSLKQRVDFLEETIKTLTDISSSETAKGYIEKRQQALAMSKLLNSATPSIKIDESAQEKILDSLTKQKEELDKKIAEAVMENTADILNTDLEKLFSYEIKTEGIEIQAFNGFDIGNLVIPSEIIGLPVIAIRDEAFKNLEVKEVYMADSVIYIGNAAFQGCKSLEKVRLSQGLKHIGRSAFMDCEKLNNLDLPDSLLEMGEQCFENTGIEYVVIPKYIKALPKKCFWRCDKLKNVVLNNGLQKIEALVFGSDKLARIVIPKSVEEVDGYALCVNLKDCRAAFLGMNTKYAPTIEGFSGTIYCLPGSEVQKQARLKIIPVRPLSDFAKP